MQKLYPAFILYTLFFAFTVNGHGQVNYVFTASRATYTPIANATRLSFSNPTPTGYYEEDEGFANAVPIGFSFNYNNQNFTKININVNGFATFGSAFTIDVNDRYSTNSLANGPKQTSGLLGIIAPMWDDLRLQDTFGLSCKTQGIAPNRIFTVQWNNVYWNYNAMAPAISFQMKLYETSNAIEFIYQPLNGAIANASASIGIATCTQCIGNFLSVGSIGSDLSVSGVREYDGIDTKPVDGQVFRFDPAACNYVQALVLDNYNSRSANFSWNSVAGSVYDYALTTCALQPIVFSSTPNNNISVNGLQPGTQYYMHVRSNCSSTSKSGWVTYAFKTVCETALPYKENFEHLVDGQLPYCIKTANPLAGNGWQLRALSALPPYNNVINYTSDNIQQADAYFILPGASLEGGKSYRIKFKYKVGDSTGINQKIEIKIGTSFNTNFVGWSTIYRNIKLNELNFKDTSLLFAAPVDDIYFIAFRCYSDKNPSSLMVDDIEFSNVKPMPIKLVSFTGTRVGEKNVLAWRTSAELKNKGFELQKGADGINFKTIKAIASKGINGSSTVALDYGFNDSLPFMGYSYYRLKVADIDANEFYTQTVIVKTPLPFVITYNKIYPNPVSDVVTAIVTSPYSTKGYFVIADAYGKVLMNLPVSVIMGDNVIKVDVSKLNKGIYMSRLTCTLGGETGGATFIKL